MKIVGQERHKKLPYRDPYIQENLQMKFFQSSLKSHILRVTLYELHATVIQR